MSIFRVIRSALGCAGHWIGESYCAVGQKIVERIEQISDTIAEQRHLAGYHVEPVRTSHVPEQQVIEIKEFRVINGHRHLDRSDRNHGRSETDEIGEGGRRAGESEPPATGPGVHARPR